MQDSKSIVPIITSGEKEISPSLSSNVKMEGAVITIVGVGLISGSFALAMKEKGFAKKGKGIKYY